MSAWKYVKAGFWQQVPLPWLGRVPLNAVALAGFGVAGFDHGALWAVGASWQVLWLIGTAGRASYRRAVDAAAQRESWRRLEERRLRLYNQLPEADRQRHHTLLQKCQERRAALLETGAVVDLMTWLHLKLLLARRGVKDEKSPPARSDPDWPRLHAVAAVELTDPARARLADEAAALLDPRHALAESGALDLARIEAVLRRLEASLAGDEAVGPVRPEAAGAENARLGPLPQAGEEAGGLAAQEGPN